MKTIRIFSMVGILTLSVLFAGSSIMSVEAEAGDVWPVFHHDPQHTGRSPYQGPQNSGLVWSFPLEGFPGTPVIGADGTIYLPTGWLTEDSVGYLYAINPDGTQKWRTTLAILPGYSAPALAPDGTIYIHGSGDEGNIVAVEKLHSINPVDGSINWTFLPNDIFGIFTTLHSSSPAVVADGTIYFGSINMDFFALNPDGTLKWWDRPSATSFASSPSVAPDGTVYIVDECTTLFAYDPDGVMLWQYTLAPACAGNYSAPAIGSDGTLYVGEAVNKSLHAINPDGTLKWSFPTGHQIESTVAIGSDGTLYLGSDGLYAINPDGTQKWHFSTEHSGDTSPILGSDGMLYWRTYWDYFMIKPDGTQRWTFGMGSSLAWGQDSVIGSDGTLYIPYSDDFTPANNSLKAYRTIPLPDPFSKTSPASGSLDQPINSLVLEWAPTAGAVSYSYCYYQAGGSCTWFNNGTATTKTLNGLLRNTTHYWRVKAFNSLGDPIEADDGTPWSFTTLPDPPDAFSKVSPTSSQTGVAIYPSLDLSWDPSTGATSYQYCVYPQLSSCAGWFTTTKTSAQVTGLLPGQWYKWQVIALNVGGTTNADVGPRLFLSASLPGSFIKTSPANLAANVSLTPSLQWNPSSGATEYQYCYDTSDNDACNDVWRSAGLDTSVTLTSLERATTYSWQVRSVGPGGLRYATTESDWRTFTTIPPVPSAFTKTSPADGATHQPMDLTLTWDPAPGATGYQYCLTEDAILDPCNSGWTSNGVNTSVPIASLTANTHYYWQVRAGNPGGTTDADGGTWASFTTRDPPLAFGKSAPADDAVNRLTPLTLIWGISGNAASYEYCLYKAGMPACADDAWTNNGTARTKTLSGLLAGTTYYWHVRAVNMDGTTYSNGTTAFWSFTTSPQLKVVSIGTGDGWILESGENTNLGGSMNVTATTLRLGDDALRKQYRSILSFGTGAGLPDNAVITRVTLKVRRLAVFGGINPVALLQGFMLDIRRGTFGTPALLKTDWQAITSKTIGPFTPPLVGGWYSFDLTSAKAYINKLATGSGLTQIRLRFKLDDNNNSIANYLSLYSGEAAAASRPQLIVEYYVP